METMQTTFAPIPLAPVNPKHRNGQRNMNQQSRTCNKNITVISDGDSTVLCHYLGAKCEETCDSQLLLEDPLGLEMFVDYHQERRPD